MASTEHVDLQGENTKLEASVESHRPDRRRDKKNRGDLGLVMNVCLRCVNTQQEMFTIQNEPRGDGSQRAVRAAVV
jgi:hypothetical protein